MATTGLNLNSLKTESTSPGKFAQWLEPGPVDQRVMSSYPTQGGQGHVPRLEVPQPHWGCI